MVIGKRERVIISPHFFFELRELRVGEEFMEAVLFEQDLGMFYFVSDGILVLQDSEMYISYSVE